MTDHDFYADEVRETTVPLSQMAVDICRHLNLDVETRVLLITLSHRASARNNFICYPGMAMICRDTGLTKPTIISIVSALEEHGLIGVNRSKKPNKQVSDVNTYDLSPLIWHYDQMGLIPNRCIGDEPPRKTMRKMRMVAEAPKRKRSHPKPKLVTTCG